MFASEQEIFCEKELLDHRIIVNDKKICSPSGQYIRLRKENEQRLHGSQEKQLINRSSVTRK